MENVTSSSLENTAEDEYWNSSNGQKWVEFQDELDTLFKLVKDRLLQRTNIETGERVLDVGCGTGATTRHAASLIGCKGRVVGVDISEPLLDCGACQKLKSVDAPIKYILGDAQTYNFNANTFDLIISRFGMMFFADPVAAFKNLSGALRPGGRLSFVCWSAASANPWFSIPREVAIEQLGNPAPKPATAPGPFAFSDIDYVLDIMKKAGLKETLAEVEKIDLFYSGSVAAATNLARNVGPIMRITNELGASPHDVNEITKNVMSRLQEFSVEGGVRIPATLNFFSASKV